MVDPTRWTRAMLSRGAAGAPARLAIVSTAVAVLAVFVGLQAPAAFAADSGASSGDTATAAPVEVTVPTVPPPPTGIPTAPPCECSSSATPTPTVTTATPTPTVTTATPTPTVSTATPAKTHTPKPTKSPDPLANTGSNTWPMTGLGLGLLGLGLVLLYLQSAVRSRNGTHVG